MKHNTNPKWEPEILNALKAGGMGFNRLREAIPAISAKVLSAKLKSLQDRGCLRREVTNVSPVRVTYSITTTGTQVQHGFETIATALGEGGSA